MSGLAITRTIFEGSLLSALAGLTSVALMFNILYQMGCLNQFGVVQTQIGEIAVTIEFTNLLVIILILIAVKTLLYTFETIKNLTKG